MSDVIAFTGYAPDLSPDTPGIFTECSNIIPQTDGFQAQNAAMDVGVDALASYARGFAITKKLDGTKRTFAATQTKLYELSGTSWADRSQAGNYNIGADLSSRARFAQFGNVTLAAVGTANRIQSSTSGAFADVSATAPKATIVETVNNFVFAFNFIDDSHGLGTLENGWWCSAVGDEADWTPSVSTQSVSGQFLETAGGVVAARRLGSNIVAYKENSTFIGEYVGVPTVWSWRQLTGEIGTFCQESVVNVGTAHFFISKDDFQIFDGSRIASIGTPVRKKFFSEFDQSYRSRITTAHDRTNSLIYWFYPSKTGAGVIDKCLVYNYKTDKWGRSDATIELAAEYIEPGITYDGLGSKYATWDDLPTVISYDSSFWSAESAVVSFFNTSHDLTVFNGVPLSSSITTGHFGDIAQFTTVDRIRPRFISTPSSSEMLYSYSDTNADAMTQNITTALINNYYDMLWTARWHKFRFNFTGSMKITGIAGDFVTEGID